MAAGKPHSFVAPQSLSSTSSESEFGWACPVELVFLVPRPLFRLKCLLSFIVEVAFGGGAQSMTAGKPHGVMALASLASISSESESNWTCLVELGFLV